jgi:hypothetical protein
MKTALSIFERTTPMVTIYEVTAPENEAPVAIFQTREEAENFIQLNTVSEL